MIEFCRGEKCLCYFKFSSNFHFIVFTMSSRPVESKGCASWARFQSYTPPLSWFIFSHASLTVDSSQSSEEIAFTAFGVSCGNSAHNQVITVHTHVCACTLTVCKYYLGKCVRNYSNMYVCLSKS